MIILAKLTIGLDLGGTKIAAALVGPEGEILAEDRWPTVPERGPEAVSDDIADLVRKVAGDRWGEVSAVGLGAPGPLNIKLGLIYNAPNLGWFDVPITRMLEKRLQLPLFLENDANAAGFGEWAVGAGRGTQDLVYLTISTGIGGGIVIGGRVYHGRNDSAGEVGHMTILPNGPRCGCGRLGCWEALCSGTGIANNMIHRLREGAPSTVWAMAGGDCAKVTSAMVAQAAREGDAEAEAAMEQAVFYLAVGITNLVHILNPEMVVLGGGVTNLGDQLFVPLRALVKERAYPNMVKDLPIVPAQLGDKVGVLGAAMVAMRNERP